MVPPSLKARERQECCLDRISDMQRTLIHTITLDGWDEPGYEIPELKPGTNFDLAIPLGSIGSTNNPMDIASDYAWVLHAAELLSPHVSLFSHRHQVTNYSHSEILSFTPANPTGCQAAVREIGLIFSDDENGETEQARKKANDFEVSLLDYPIVCFPELADSFVANYVNSLEANFDEMELTNEIYHRFPTWAYRFWKSFISQKAGTDIYSSTHSWVLPRGFSTKQLLEYLDWELSPAPTETQLLQATPIKIGFLPWMLASSSVCVEIPFNCLNVATECWHHCLWNEAQARDRQLRSFSGAVTNYRSDVHWEDTCIHRDYLVENQHKEWSVSGDGSIVTVSLEDVTLLTFLGPESKLRPEALHGYLAEAEKACGVLYQNCGLPANSPCQWTLLDDELFEQLCYDILLRCERFNPNRMRKLGKSRSRDGGRDIEAWTQARPECPPQKWIYQCKFSTAPGSSLSGSQLSISDVVDQFEADGFGVMTNRTIDATLYDKLDQIATNRSKRGACLAVDPWSIHEIERFLYPRKDLIARYFQRSTVKPEIRKQP
ncbi:MAG: hypothetical protein JWO95_3116 [Verrucomicrobiales bacterium]|nr:hypothetical protein [Verrucomicrobiales bacterium]